MHIIFGTLMLIWAMYCIEKNADANRKRREREHEELLDAIRNDGRE
jgi:hypothetical protein